MTGSRWLVATGIVACGLSWYLVVPPAPSVLTAVVPGSAAPVRGAIHVHTRRSDGTGTVDDVAAAAARAGLQFVILTDHGDGTRQAEPPSYRGGVLCIDAAEVSTDGGHVVAFDLPPAPYPLGGEARDVVEDIRRLGGLSIAAHPGSARPGLRWRDWDEPFDGLEWLNGDSEWRDERWPDLARTLLTYPFSRVATLTALLDRPEETLKHWDELTRQRRVVAVAAADAHARFGPGGDPYGGAVSLHVPSYERVFRTLTISLPQVQLSGAAREDARAVLDAIRSGHVYSTVDGLASPGVLAFSAVSGSNRAAAGDELHLDGSVALRVETDAPAGARITLVKDGATIASSPPPTLEYAAPSAPGVYRIEVELSASPGTPPVPWIVSNPIYVSTGNAVTTRPSEGDRAIRILPVYVDGPATDWRVEKNPRSQGRLDVVPSVGGTQISLRYGIGGTVSEGLFVAAAMPAGPNMAEANRLTFTARALRPMRVSVQLRVPDAAQDRRWRRSVYLDEMARTITVFFDDMTPIDESTGPLVLSEVRDVLFVVDAVNTKPGSNGQIWLDDVQYAR